MESTLSTTQDGKGYLWVGTDGGGLMRFDGKKFSEVGPKGKNFQYHVSSMFPTTDDAIYFTTLYDGVFKYADDKYTFVYKPTRKDGSCQLVTMVDDLLAVVAEYSISIVSEQGVPIRKLHLNSRLRVFQLLKIPQGILLFTNMGNFLIRNGKIGKLDDLYRGVARKSFRPRFGTFRKNKLILYDEKVGTQLEMLLNNDGSVFSGKLGPTNFDTDFIPGEHIVNVSERQTTAYLLTDKGKIYRLANNRLQRIVNNSTIELSDITNMFTDRNSDLWMNTSYGIYKISLEPFTKVELHPMFQDRTVFVIHRTKSGLMILGNTAGEVRIGEMYTEPTLYNYRCYQVSESSFGTFLATDQGILELKGNRPVPTNFPLQKGQRILMMHWDGRNFWYSLDGEGLVRYTPSTKQVKRFSKMFFEFPDHFYTAQNNFDNSIVYFGSNNGIFAYSIATEKLRPLKYFARLGSFSANSTTDRYGTCWFSLDKGLAGITSRGDYVIVDDEKRLPSTLFYTLSADNYGNLLAGTNVGVNVIEVDRNGYVLRSRNYSVKEGFGGYETNARSQFQFGNYCYVGTVEGVYLINTEVLRQYPAPPTPIIVFGRENELGEPINGDEKAYYTFKCLLPKSNAVKYSYRIKGVDDKWSDFSFQDEINISWLSNGKYRLEVRASYDGVAISNTATYIIKVETPLWQTKWFIVIIVIVLGIFNIAFLEWSKSFLSNNVFNTKDVTVDVKIIPRMILFGLAVNGIMLVIVDRVEDTVFDTQWLNIVVTSLMLILYLLSRYYVKYIGNAPVITGFFYVAYALILAEDYWLIYTTNIHPYPVFSITMVTGLIPFIVSRIRWVIVICLLQLFISATLLIWLEDTIYNEILFIAAITISGGLTIMVTYLRNDSLEKLIFVSGVINKGNVMALSFNQKGTITYCSENISDFFAIDFTSVVGKASSILNPFVVSSEMRNINLRDEFEDGRIFLIPMYNKKGEVMWIEWSCKYFNESVRVIMGQDVTDKLTLSTNYQSLVENAQDMIFNTDVDGNFIFANERCVQLFGYRNDVIIGKNALSMIAPEHRERVREFYADQFKNRIHHTYLEFPIRSRDGRTFWVGQNVSMVYEPGSRKRISGFIALARDITEKRANELLIEQQNKDITASINYAKRIQINLLPDQQVFHRHFEQSFVLFRPKDIVSGDFYWTQEVDGKLIVVVADCTGHGVPGAFMTILGINLLNQIVRERKQYEPDVILNQLNMELRTILPNKQGTIFDGMDLLVTVFDNDKLSFASSGVQFVHWSPAGFAVYKSTRKMAGDDEAFEKETIAFGPDDAFYFLTDGYQKQFGSIRNKKFSFKRVEELLEKVHIESMALQKKYFENAWSNWSDGHEQTDDITVIGVRGFKRN